MNVENECIIENILHTYGCAIVSDDDKDFGQLQSVETNTNHSELLRSQQIEKARLSHLTEYLRQQLLNVLDKFACCFTEKPGYCNLVKHTTQIFPDFKLKRLKAYGYQRN